MEFIKSDWFRISSVAGLIIFGAYAVNDSYCSSEVLRNGREIEFMEMQVQSLQNIQKIMGVDQNVVSPGQMHFEPSDELYRFQGFH